MHASAFPGYKFHSDFIYMCVCVHSISFVSLESLTNKQNMCMCRSQWSTSGIIPQGLGLSNSIRLAGQWAQRICLSWPPQCWNYKYMQPCLAFLRGSWGSNSGFHTFLASTLLSEPSPQTGSVPFLGGHLLQGAWTLGIENLWVMMGGDRKCPNDGSALTSHRLS